MLINPASILALQLVMLAVRGIHALPATTGDDAVTAPDLHTELAVAAPDPTELTGDDVPGERAKRDINPAHCVDYLYVMAHTASHANAGTNAEHEIEMIANGQTRTYILKDPQSPADGYERFKGDLWKIKLTTDFGFTGCVNKGDITSIAIEERSDDGWKIDSIITVLKDTYFGGADYEVASLDVDANEWIEGDVIAHRRFELNLII